MTAIKLGVDSYPLGKALGFDPVRGRVLTRLSARKVFLPPGAGRGSARI